ncbi:MAG: glycosyltransferase family 4 protein, partial [Myxococcaceae bacterium]
YYFLSHRLLIAKAAQREGFEVYVATHVEKHEEKLRQDGFTVFPTIFSRNNKNLLTQIKALFQLVKIFRQVRPDIVHNIALKAIVFGAIASWINRLPKTINLVAGLGVVFTDQSKKYKLISRFARRLARVLLQHSGTLVIVQNSDDMSEMKLMAPRAKICLIRGSGVNIHDYAPILEPTGVVKVTLVGRMLWHKGVGELVEASRLLKSWGEELEILLVGGLDFGNPACISKQQLLDWQSVGLIKWLGHQMDIARVWAESHIAVLPSYREGLPKSLLEAAACGKPIIAADAPGCREIVVDRYNGFLVPVRNAEALAKAIQRLIHKPELRVKMGYRSRQLVCKEFSNEHVVEQTMRIYHELLQAT